MNFKAALLAVPLAAALVACPTPTATPDFTISSAAPTSLSFTKPTSGDPAPQTVTVTIAPAGGFADAVTLSLVAPANSSGVTGTGAIAAGAASGTLTVNATAAATVGASQAYKVQATSGSITRTLDLPITVTAAPTIAALGVSVGTYNIKSAGGVNTKGFAMLVRVRDNSNAIVNGFATGISYLISGPSGWNGNVNATASGPDDFIFPTGGAFGVLRSPPATNATNPTAINGTYTVTTTINSVQYSGTPQVTDANQVLPLPAFTTNTITGSGATRTATIAWNTVAGAASYRVQVLKNGSVIDSSNQTGTTHTVSGIAFTAGDTFVFRVIAYPVNITAADVTLPVQFNISSTDQNAV